MRYREVLGEPDIPGILKVARESANLNQREMADRVGCNPSLISLWESGTRKIKTVVFFKILAICNVPVTIGVEE